MRNLIVGADIIHDGVLRPGGGSQFISAVFRGLEPEWSATSSGDSKLWLNKPPPNPLEDLESLQKRAERCSGVAGQTGKRRESPWKMAPASLVLAWLLVTMRMVTSAAYLQPEEEGELAPHLTQPGLKCQGSKKRLRADESRGRDFSY